MTVKPRKWRSSTRLRPASFFRTKTRSAGGSAIPWTTLRDIEVVGILRDVRYNDLREPPPPTMYVPHRQNNPEDLVFTIRTAGDPVSVMSAARAAVSDTNPDIPVVTVRDADVGRSSSGSRRKKFSRRRIRSSAASRCSSPRSACSG